MKAGNLKRGLAMTILLVCVVVLPGQASADPVPDLSVNDFSASEGTGGSTTFTFTITRTGDTTGVTKVTASVPGGSPDFAAGPQELTFEAGDLTKTYDVAITTDALDEPDETFVVSLSAVDNGNIVDPSGLGTIQDDDPEPSIASISDVSVVEGNAGTVDAAITVTLSAASGKLVTVPYSTAPATATEPADYEHKTGVFSFVPGEDLSETVVVKVKGDTIFEPNETFSVVITSPTNATLGSDNRGEITITDDDSLPTPTVSSPSGAEGNSGLTDLTFEVTLPSPRPEVRFNYRTVAQSATGEDFNEVGGAQLTFPADTSSTPTKLPVTIKVKGDQLDENDESFTLQLLNPTTEAVVATATGTITNDDNNSELVISDSSADEPSSGTATLKFSISLSAPSGRAVSVGWQTVDGTATAGTDYNAASGTVDFAPGESAKTIDVTVIGDTINEANETVLVNLAASGANLVDAQAQGTIVDKNAPPSLSISEATAQEGGGANFTVELAGNTIQTVSVGFSTTDGTAREPGDYASRRGTLTFAPGEKSKTVVVTVVDDAIAEPLETFSVTLGDAVNGAITKSRGTAVIEASDQVGTSPSGNPLRPVVPPAAGTLLPKMMLAPRTVKVTRTGLARLVLTCAKASPIACRGSITLQTTGKPAVKLGSKTFLVAKGKKKTLGVKLSPRARKLLAKRPTLRARVIVMVKTGKKSLRVVPGVITLKAAPKSAKPKSAKKSTAPKDPPTDVTVGN